MQISSEDVSVVIQGAVCGKFSDTEELQLTKRAIASVRKHLPNAEIILSTWENSYTEHITGYDLLLKSKDPGATSWNETTLKDQYNNINRQIVSTRNGLEKATRKYAVKMRTDSHLVNSNFLFYLEKYKLRSEKHLLFQGRIIIPTLFTCNPGRRPLPFHVSDCFQVGRLNDLQDLWHIPLAPEPQTTRYFQDISKPHLRLYPEDYLFRYTPEQYIWIEFCKKKSVNIFIDYYCDLNLHNFFDSELSIINNFVIVDPVDLGIYISDKIMAQKSLEYLYSYQEWEALYEVYATQNNFLPHRISLYMQALTAVYKYSRINTSIGNLKNKTKQSLKSILPATKNSSS